MSEWLGYIGRRLIQLFLVIVVAGTINFLIPRLIPGDPVDTALASLAARGGSQSFDAAALKTSWNAKFGFDKPLVTQYINYWSDVAKGDLGYSLVNFPQPVTEKITAAIPWTLGLLGVSTIIAFFIGTFAGALVAWPKSPRVVRILAPPFLLLSSVPYYLLAILLIFIFAVVLKTFPPAGGFSPTTIIRLDLKSFIDITSHAFLPALSIVLGAIGFWALGMRSLMVNVLGEDYILYAESKGLKPRRIFIRYGMRNALLPQVTALALAMGTIVSGAVLVEAIFNYPGLGGLLFASILGKDIFVINGIVLMLIVTLAIAVFVIDLVIPIVDPRIRQHS
jgi:peptide/nickel transport system permease protein